MTRALVLLSALVATGCGVDRDYATENGDQDQVFDDDDVVHAGDGEGCALVPEAEACVAEFPVQWVPAEAAQVEEVCEASGYDCCDRNLYISVEAASCIADSDARVDGAVDSLTFLACDHEFLGPIWGVWVDTDAPEPAGLGIHAVTGAVTWYNDGAGVV